MHGYLFRVVHLNTQDASCDSHPLDFYHDGKDPESGTGGEMIPGHLPGNYDRENESHTKRPHWWD